MVADMTPSHSGRRDVAAFTLAVIGLALLVFALAGPQWGEKREQVERRGIDVVFAVDISRSMLEESSRELLSASVVDGSLRIGERVLPVQRVRIEVMLFFAAGETEIPVGISIDAMRSDAIPLHGIVGGDFRIEIIGDDGESTIVDTRVDLLAFGVPESDAG